MATRPPSASPLPPKAEEQERHLGEEGQRVPNPIAVQKLLDRYFEWCEEKYPLRPVGHLPLKGEEEQSQEQDEKEIIS